MEPSPTPPRAFFPRTLRAREHLFRLFFCGFFLSCTMLPAEPPPREFAQEMGYKFLIQELPVKRGARGPRDKYFSEPVSHSISEKDSEEFRDFLTPRLYQRPESASLIPMLLKFQAEQPDSAKITRKLGLTCLQAGQPREALYWFTKTFSLDRTDLSALWNMATLSYRLGDYQSTYAFLGEYARLDPYSAWGRIARGFQKKGTFGEIDSEKAFSNIRPRTGTMEPGGAPSGGNSLLVVDGRPVSQDEYLTPGYIEQPSPSPSEEPFPPPEESKKVKNTKPPPKKPSINDAEIEIAPNAKLQPSAASATSKPVEAPPQAPLLQASSTASAGISLPAKP